VLRATTVEGEYTFNHPGVHGIVLMPDHPVTLPISYGGAMARDYTIPGGSVGYLPPNISTSGYQPAGKTSVYVRIHDHVFRDTAKGIITDFDPWPNPIIDDSIIRQIGKTLGDIASSEEFTWSIVIDSLQAALAARIMQVCGARLEAPTNMPDARIGMAIDFIESNLSSELRLADIARAANTSQFHLARKFKQQTGWTPAGYIWMARIRLAKRLLQHTKRPIIDIAFQCGFSSQSHFSALFKRHAGVTPAAYRASFT